MSDDERITWDQFLRTALVLRQTMDRSEDELFEAAWAFLKRAYARYHRYRYNSLPPVWDQGAFIPPLLRLETAAVRITGKRNKVQAMAALEKFMPAWLEEARERGGLSADFCAQVKEDYQKWRLEPVREKQRQVGKKTKNSSAGRKKPKIFLDPECLRRVTLTRSIFSRHPREARRLWWTLFACSECFALGP